MKKVVLDGLALVLSRTLVVWPGAITTMSVSNGFT